MENMENAVMESIEPEDINLDAVTDVASEETGGNAAMILVGTGIVAGIVIGGVVLYKKIKAKRKSKELATENEVDEGESIDE